MIEHNNYNDIDSDDGYKIPDNHYVDNKKFKQVMTQYRENYDYSVKHNLQKPIIPDEVGIWFIQMAEKIFTKYNFREYTWKADMISDGIKDCVSYLHNFDPTHPKCNPHSYFTTFIFRAFVRRIKLEKKTTRIKDKIILEFTDSLYDNSFITEDEKQLFHSTYLNEISEHHEPMVINPPKKKLYKKSIVQNSNETLIDDFLSILT